MENFKYNKPSGRRDFGGRSSNRASMHQAVCSSCGKDCQVPFKPTGSKPVYCSECFEKNGGQSSRRNEGRNFGRSNSGDRQMFDAVCDQCGASCQLPFRPTSGKPIYCSKCFEEKNTSGSRSTNQPQYGKQIEALNAKLDKILKLLTPVEPKEEVQTEKIVKKVPVKKAKKKTATVKKTKTAKKTSSKKE
jgi:CxxC-x17-CxxC domain-containing protein